MSVQALLYCCPTSTVHVVPSIDAEQPGVVSVASPVQCLRCQRYITICNQQSTRLPTPSSVATASTSRTAPFLVHLPSAQHQVACSSRERILLHTAHTPATSSASCSPACLARDLPVPFSAQALRLASTNHPAALNHADQLGRAFLIPSPRERTSPRSPPSASISRRSLPCRRCHQYASLQSQGLKAPGFAQRQPAKQLQWLLALPWPHAERFPAHEFPRRASAKGPRPNPRPRRLLAQHLRRARALQAGAGKSQEEPAQALYRGHVQVWRRRQLRRVNNQGETSCRATAYMSLTTYPARLCA